MACWVALGSGSLAPTAANRCSGLAWTCGSLLEPDSGPRCNSSATTMLPVVIVPVLSRHKVSTRARSSTEANSRRSAFFFDSEITPAMNAMLVNNTNPSGTIATEAATTPDRAMRQSPSLLCISRQNNRMAIGGIANIKTFRILLTPERSSELTRENLRAS
ncbi:unannotated protein [freshwater metagenome]|uniref:Unannotated protein n=1 Tax=freshwater metagenome TaxID=449393 RepID=A0A6J7UXB1_9ZZZZ